SEGHSKLETIRCLKRYLAREVYYLLNPGPQTITPNTRHHRKAA
ncbi:IS110 family transposase, partial [Streptomyces parvulus]